MLRYPPTLTRTLSKHFSLHPSRLKTLTGLILGAMSGGDVQYHSLSRHVESENSVSALRKSERFFQKQCLGNEGYARSIVDLIGHKGKFDLSLDRSNWKRGNKKTNYLVLAWRVSKHLSVPLFFIDLDKAGNSPTDKRIDLIQLFVEIFGADKIASLCGDREFIGQKWIKYLASNKAPFFMRIKENMLIEEGDSKVNVRKYFEQLRISEIRHIQLEVYEMTLMLEGTRSKSGELVIIMSNQLSLKHGAILKKYRERWSIEMMFKNLKSAGFNWENTHMKMPDYLVKLLIVLGLAVLCVFLMAANSKIPWRKTVGYPLKSIFRQGFLNFQYLISQEIVFAIEQLESLLSIAKSFFSGRVETT